VSDVEVRPFRRADREQLAELVNAHVQAVVPGLAVSVNAVLSQLEGEPREFLVDPWVVDRRTLVAVQRGRVVAAAHLLRYGAGPAVGEGYRDAGEIRWLLCWPDAPFWPGATDAGDAVAAEAVAALRRTGARRVYADGALPAPGVYGIPEVWPHVQGILQRVGFTHRGRTEAVHLAEVAVLARPDPPAAGLVVRRTLGVNGTRFTGLLGEEEIGSVEVELQYGDATRVVGQQGWADVGNLHVAPPWRRRGIATWLLGQAAEWLRLAHVDRLLDYSTSEEPEYAAFLHSAGFRLLTRTTRGWERTPPAPDGRGGPGPSLSG
jgi:GNAT superfamily N-acetyltransferase